ELRAVGSRSGIGHRKAAASVPVRIILYFVVEAVAWTAPARSVRVAALDHEILDHAMEHGTVIEILTSEEYEVVHGVGSVFSEQLADDGTAGGFERSSVRLRGVDRHGRRCRVLFGHKNQCSPLCE